MINFKLIFVIVALFTASNAFFSQEININGIFPVDPHEFHHKITEFYEIAKQNHKNNTKVLKVALKAAQYGIDTIKSTNLPATEILSALENLKASIDKYMNIDYPVINAEVHYRVKRATNSSSMCPFWNIENAILTQVVALDKIEVSTLESISSSLSLVLTGLGVAVFLGAIPGWLGTILGAVLPVIITIIQYALIPSNVISTFFINALADANDNIKANAC